MDNLKYQDDRYDSGDMYAESELENGRENILAVQGDQGQVESKDERRSVTKAHGKAISVSGDKGTNNPFFLIIWEHDLKKLPENEIVQLVKSMGG